MRCVLACLLCFLNAAVLAQPADSRRVTFRHPAAPVARVVDALAKQESLNLDVSPALWDEVVLVDVTDLPLDALMNAIGEAAAAGWREEGALLMLVPSSERRAQRIARDRDTTRPAIQKSLAEMGGGTDAPIDSEALFDLYSELMSTYAKIEAGEDEWARISQINVALQAQEPGRRLLSRILTEIDPELLVNLDPNERIVFSSDPNRVQRSMPRSFRRALEAFDAERTQVARVQSMVSGLGNYRSLVEGPDRWVAARVTVAVERRVYGYGEQISAILNVVDPSGQVLFSEYAGLASMDLFGEAWEAETPTFPVTDLSPFSQTLWNGLYDLAMMGTAAQLDPEVRATVLSPLTHDPLESIVSETFFLWNATDPRDLVASVPDTALLVTLVRQYEVPGKVGMPVHIYDRTEVGGVTLLRPRREEYHRLTRLDRKALQRLCEPRRGGLSFADLAEFAAEGHTSGTESSIFSLFALLRDGDYSATIGYLSPRVLRLIGSLPGSTVGRLLRGEVVPLGRLSGEAGRLAEELLTSQELMSWTPSEGEEYDPLVSMLATEPTEIYTVLPDGPFGLRMSQTVREAWFESSTQWGGSFYETSPEDIAYKVMLSLDPGFFQRQGWDTSARVEDYRYMLGQQTDLVLELVGGTRFVRTVNATIPGVDMGRPLTFDQLPEEMRARIELRARELLAEYRSQGETPVEAPAEDRPPRRDP